MADIAARHTRRERVCRGSGRTRAAASACTSIGSPAPSSSCASTSWCRRCARLEHGADHGFLGRPVAAMSSTASILVNGDAVTADIQYGSASATESGLSNAIPQPRCVRRPCRGREKLQRPSGAEQRCCVVYWLSYVYCWRGRGGRDRLAGPATAQSAAWSLPPLGARWSATLPSQPERLENWFVAPDNRTAVLPKAGLSGGGNRRRRFVQVPECLVTQEAFCCWLFR